MKKPLKVTILLTVVLVIVAIIAIIISNAKRENKENKITEYTPQAEISEENLRETLVTLYFENSETGMLMPEARLIDSKELLNNPYKVLVEMLISGPKNEKFKTVIPQGTKLNNAEIKKDIVYLDFSEEFTKGVNLGAEKESNIIYSIVNTLTELTEVTGVKISVNGNESAAFEDGGINFKEIFVRE
ncbi:MAG: GerMN domain-containing protein [Lachnospiraceae bacterium]|nr:GerMN domain-containing protein [Lachnospiraceae bacterium]